MTFSPDPNVVIPPTVKYTMNLLKAASHHSTVKRFTLSSSCASAASPGDTRIIDKDTWNDSAIERAWAPAPYEPSRGFDVYAASKALSERDAWQWYDKEKPGFILNAGSYSQNLVHIYFYRLISA
jgi:nucleoside-diphosphate-sugar epimerase